MHRETKQLVAIKLMKNIFADSYQARKTLREIKILRKLSRIPNNLFTTLLLDIILPVDINFGNLNGPIEEEKTPPNDSSGMQVDFLNVPDKRKTSDNELDSQQPFDISKFQHDLDKFTHIFLVMELVESDMKKLLSSDPQVPLQEEHIITILYNSLCALNFMHSANILHRDIKPGNFLISSSCSVKICDFGLARTIPKKEDFERDFRDARKKSYKKVDRTGDKETQYQSRLTFKDKASEKLREANVHFESRKRDLSNCVVSRWYRAPEIILTQKRYD